MNQHETIKTYKIITIFNNKYYIEREDGTIVNDDIIIFNQHLSFTVQNNSPCLFISKLDIITDMSKYYEKIHSIEYFMNGKLHHLTRPAETKRFSIGNKFKEDYYVDGWRYTLDEFKTDYYINKLRRLEKLNLIFKDKV